MWIDHYIVVSRPVCGFKSMQWLIFITPLRIWRQTTIRKLDM